METVQPTYRRSNKPRWFILGGIVLVLFFTFAFGRAYYQNYQVRQEVLQLQQEAERLQAKKIELLGTLEHVQSQAFVEEKARTELNLVKPGEKMAIITTSGESESKKLSADQNSEADSISNIRKWWNYFFSDEEQPD